MRRLPIRTVGLLSLSLLAAPALANSTGITGQSNKQGQSCNGCHLGASAPTVTLTGPTELEPGATGQYTLTIRGGAARVGGMNVAVDNAAAVLQPGEGSQKQAAELTHSGPQEFSNSVLAFNFSMVAPSTPGATLKLFGAGNSANGDHSSDGDRGGTTTLDVTVKGGAPTPTPTEDVVPTEDAAAAQGGCSTAAGMPLSVLGLVLAGLPRLRRRQG